VLQRVVSEPLQEAHEVLGADGAVARVGNAPEREVASQGAQLLVHGLQEAGRLRGGGGSRCAELTKEVGRMRKKKKERGGGGEGKREEEKEEGEEGGVWDVLSRGAAREGAQLLVHGLQEAGRLRGGGGRSKLS
jgi:hypothetical protein